jgi:hypothetical protein
MRFYRLRIVLSAACLIACVLLVALWVRSYWRMDVVSGHGPDGFGLCLSSMRGSLVGSRGSPAGPNDNQPWKLNWNRELPPDAVGARGRAFISVRIERLPCVTSVFIPIWIVWAMGIALSAAPWLLSWRFSLRAMLAAVAVIASVLGVLVYAARE